MTGFQTKVNQQPAPGIEGAISSSNPSIGYVTGPGGLVAGTLGLTIGRFAWATARADGSEVANGNASLVAGGVSREPSGFVAREMQGINTQFLSESTMGILPGQITDLKTRGDFWVRVQAASARNLKAFASLLTGEVRPAAAGSVIPTASVTASFATNVMTVTAVASGTLKAGQQVFGTGLPGATYIAAQLTGTPGAAGTYSLTTTPGTVASGAVVGSDYIETRFRMLSVADAGEVAKIGFGD